MDIAQIKSPDIEVMDKDKILILIPLGSIEAHGSHLPLGTDSIIAEHFAEKISNEIDNVLLAPTISYSYNLINYDYPGTISISPEHFSHYLEDIIKSFYHHGFRNFLLFSSHGGNEIPVKLAIMNLLRDIPDVKIAFKTWWKLARLRSKHAERIETSLMLKISPDLVDMGKAVDCDPVNPWHWFKSRKEYYPETYGVNGDPSKAGLEDGELLYKKILTALHEYIQSILT